MRPCDEFDGLWLPLLLAAIAFGLAMLIAEHLPWLRWLVGHVLPL